MPKNNITASGLDRYIHCPASAVLPQEPRARGAAAKRGTGIHTFLARIAAGKSRSEALEGIRAGKKTSELIDVDFVPAGRPEVSFAYDCETGASRELGSFLDREYGDLGENEIAGTADLIVETEDTIRVLDWKTGKTRVTPARHNLQVAFLALAALGSREDQPTVFVDIVYIDKDGTFDWDSAKLDSTILSLTAERLRAMMRSYHVAKEDVALGLNPKVNEGEWCLYCPALRNCPAKRVRI